MYTFLLCTYTSTVSALALALALALSLLSHYHLTSSKGFFFPLESAHYAHVVQELYGFNVLVMVESFVI